ncbi:MAG: hypothetical protein IT269_10660, partial [Saprospiraceae bacterium]|nr:hypothetical protein [Saprospiraceae bacterium]
MKFSLRFPVLLLFFLCFGLSSLQAQLNVTYPEKIVGLAPLTYDQNTASQEAAEKFWHYIFDALFNTKRFKVVDRLDGYKNIVMEKRIQSGGDFVDGKVVKQGKLQGATMMVFGHVMTAQSIESKSTNGTSTFNADLSIAIKIIDVETSEIIASVLVTPSGTSKMDDVVKNSKGILGIFSGNNCSGATGQQALDRCMSNIEKYIRQFVTENFPVEMRVFQTRPSENGKYTEYLLIGGGTDGTFREKQKLSVTRTEKINANGKTLKYTNEVVKFEILRLAE